MKGGNNMKEYYVFRLSQEAQDTEDELNELAKKGWRLVCSYAKHNYWLIMERDKKVCKSCGK